LTGALCCAATLVFGCAQVPGHHDDTGGTTAESTSSSSVASTATGGASSSVKSSSSSSAPKGGSTGGASGGSSGGSSGGTKSSSSSSSKPTLVKAGVGTGGTPVSRNGQLSISGTQLVNSQGLPVQLKGPSSMWLNWESKRFIEDKTGVQWVRDNWNASVIRAAMGVDETGGGDTLVANPTNTKNRVNQIVQNAIDLGLYVIIDFHTSKGENQKQLAVDFFKEMATKWGKYPNVLYEPFNEPLKIDWATVIKPYHQAVVDAIRAIDSKNIIILGTRDYSQEVDTAAKDPVKGTNLMYALHFYSCTHLQYLRTKADTALGLGAPIFVSEWGATHADGGTSANPKLCTDEAQTWIDWMDDNWISWAAWKFDAGSDKTCYFNGSAPTTGGWTDSMLNGHAPFVREKMKE
jgi:endoglucanase